MHKFYGIHLVGAVLDPLLKVEYYLHGWNCTAHHITKNSFSLAESLTKTRKSTGIFFLPLHKEGINSNEDNIQMGDKSAENGDWWVGKLGE